MFRIVWACDSGRLSLSWRDITERVEAEDERERRGFRLRVVSSWGAFFLA